MVAAGVVVQRQADDTGAAFEIDEATLAACAAGDPASLRQFVTRYQSMVFAYISRAAGRGPPVEDLAQEVFLRALRALPRFDERGAARPSTWLLTIAAHAEIDYRKRRREALVDDSDAVIDQVESATPETEQHRSRNRPCARARGIAAARRAT